MQNSDKRFHISEFRFQISAFQIVDFILQYLHFRFPISDSRIKSPDFAVEISCRSGNVYSEVFAAVVGVFHDHNLAPAVAASRSCPRTLHSRLSATAPSLLPCLSARSRFVG